MYRGNHVEKKLTMNKFLSKHGIVGNFVIVFRTSVQIFSSMRIFVNLYVYFDSCVNYDEHTIRELFEDWFKGCLIPNLPQNNVIVMNKVSYPSGQLYKVPGENNVKLKIQNCMAVNDIFWRMLYRSELLSVLKTFCMNMCDALADGTHSVTAPTLLLYFWSYSIEHM